METTFCELRGKEVINVLDGKRLGKIIDLVFDTRCGKILGLVVPCYNKSWNIFKTAADIFIPYSNVCKIGDDVILVEIFVQNQKSGKQKPYFVRTAQVEQTQINQPEPDGQSSSPCDNATYPKQ